MTSNCHCEENRVCTDEEILSNFEIRKYKQKYLLDIKKMFGL